MEMSVRTGSRLIVPMAIVVALILGFAVVRPTGGAIPAGSVVGKVTYRDVSGTTDLTTTIRSFTLKTEMDGTVGDPGGGGQGKASFGVPRVVQEVVAGSPMIMTALASDRHLPTITVTLYRAKTTTRAQSWVFTDATFTLDEQTQKGPASATPSETVSWVYQTVRQTTYASNGVTVSSTSCFDANQNQAC